MTYEFYGVFPKDIWTLILEKSCLKTLFILTSINSKFQILSQTYINNYISYPTLNFFLEFEEYFEIYWHPSCSKISNTHYLVYPIKILRSTRNTIIYEKNSKNSIPNCLALCIKIHYNLGKNIENTLKFLIRNYLLLNYKDIQLYTYKCNSYTICFDHNTEIYKFFFNQGLLQKYRPKFYMY